MKQVEQWLQWSGMRAEVPKCFSQVSSHLLANLSILHGQKVPFIGDRPIEFMGYPVQIPIDHMEVKASLHSKLSKLSDLLQRVDNAPVTGNQKLLLFCSGMCPRIMWDVSISHLSSTWVMTTLEAESTRYLTLYRRLCQKVVIGTETISGTFSHI